MRRFLPLFPVVILAVSGCVVIGIGDQDKEDTGDTGDTTQPSDPLPEITSLELSPDPVYTGDTLSAVATTEHTESTEWSWFVNGEAAGDGSPTLDGEDWFDKEDVVEVRATPAAGSVTGQAASLEIVVSNTAPGAPLVDINPLTPVEGVDTLLCFVSGDSEDDDGDEINYSATWTVDGVAHADTGQTNFSGDTIDPAATVAGQVWACTVAPDDGEEQGASGSAEIEIVAPAVEYADCTDDLSGLGAPVEVATASGGGSYGIGAWMADANPGAAAQIRVPRLNSVMARRNTGRVCSRWSRNPVTGMTTAMVSM